MSKGRSVSALVVVWLASGGAAFGQSILYESGIPPRDETAGGRTLDVEFWPSHRFEVTEATQIAGAGGHLSTTLSPGPIFVAIVALSGPGDFPDSFDLSSPDVVGSALVDAPGSGGNVVAPLLLHLDPGWYSLVLGTGALGAPATYSGAATGGWTDADLVQETFSIATVLMDFFGSSRDVRLFVTVPEPRAPAAALLVLLFLARRKGIPTKHPL